MRSLSSFSLSDHLDRLSQDDTLLEVLDVTVDFEHFRGWFLESPGYGDSSKGGRAPFTTTPPFSWIPAFAGMTARRGRYLWAHLYPCTRTSR